MLLLALATTLGSALLQAPPAPLTVDEARAVAEREMGVPFAGAEEVPLANGILELRLLDAGLRVQIELAGGYLCGYDRRAPYQEFDEDGNLVTPLAVSAEQAREVGMAELRLRMGEAFARVERWREDASRSGWFRISGHAPPVGDPPRESLSPRATVLVSRISGEVVSFGQALPVQAEPIAPEFPAEEAIAKALADWGIPEARLATGRLVDGRLGLWQDPYGRGELTWIIPLMAEVITHEEGPDGEDTKRLDIVGRLYKIDALTGDIRGYSGTL